MNHLEMGMDKETLQHLWHSVGKWGKTQQQRDEMFVACYEAYHCKTQDKQINKETKQSYLSVMFRNTCIDYLRRHSKRLKREILMSEMESEWEILREISINTEDTTELAVCVDTFLASLTDLERQFAKYLMEDTSYQDIADELKIPIGTVRKSYSSLSGQMAGNSSTSAFLKLKKHMDSLQGFSYTIEGWGNVSHKLPGYQPVGCDIFKRDKTVRNTISTTLQRNKELVWID